MTNLGEEYFFLSKLILIIIDIYFKTKQMFRITSVQNNKMDAPIEIKTFLSSSAKIIQK